MESDKMSHRSFMQSVTFFHILFHDLTILDTILIIEICLKYNRKKKMSNRNRSFWPQIKGRQYIYYYAFY